MPGSGGSSRPGGGAGPIKPAKTATPRVHPTYLPVRAADPSENYFFGTTAPTFVPLLPSASVSPVAVASPMATVTAAPTIMLTITPTPMRTPYPRRPSHALPYFYLYPSAGQADLPETVEAPVSWHFSAQEIASIREELTEGKYQTDAGAFLSRIEKDRIRSEG